MTKPSTIATCYLCQEVKPLQKKCHMFPKFVLNESRKRAADSHPYFFRKAENRFVKEQDIYSKYHFCTKCDNEIFGTRGEKKVAPYYKTDTIGAIKDEPFFLHFITSICFRASCNQLNLLDQSVLKAQSAWRKFLLGNSGLAIDHAVQCLYFDPESEAANTLLNNSFYFDIFEYLGMRLIWVNFPGFQIVGIISFKEESPLNPRRYREKVWRGLFQNVGEMVVNTQLKTLSEMQESDFKAIGIFE